MVHVGNHFPCQGFGVRHALLEACLRQFFFQDRREGRFLTEVARLGFCERDQDFRDRVQFGRHGVRRVRLAAFFSFLRRGRKDVIRPYLVEGEDLMAGRVFPVFLASIGRGGEVIGPRAADRFPLLATRFVVAILSNCRCQERNMVIFSFARCEDGNVHLLAVRARVFRARKGLGDRHIIFWHRCQAHVLCVAYRNGRQRRSGQRCVYCFSRVCLFGGCGS